MMGEAAQSGFSSFAIYLFVIFTVFLVGQRKIRFLHYAYWAYDQMTLLHRLPWTKDWDIRMINTIRRKRKSAIAILVKTDEVSGKAGIVVLVTTG
jgi:hypothetical protein